jgi:serralysin
VAGPTLEDEVTFLIGVDRFNKVAATAAATWNELSPPGYKATSDATKWGSSTPGTGATVSYFFNAASGWTGEEKAAWRGGMELWSAVANITFTEAASDSAANFRISRGADGDAKATLERDGSRPIGSDTILTPAATGSVVSIDTAVDVFGPIGQTLAAKGGHPLSTVVHEIGHIIGIGHGGPYNAEVDRQVQQFSEHDTMLWTLMSYIRPETTGTKFFNSYPVKGTSWGQTEQGEFLYDNEPLTPMIVDILAVQRLYGVATSGPLAGGGHTFGFNSDIEGYIGRFYDFTVNKQPVITLWTNGTNNTFDVSGFSADATISLVPGTFSSVGGLKNNVAIAFDTVIEKAIGGDGKDTIVASDVASTLIGGRGSDNLVGRAGNDVLTGGADPDTFDPGGGLNILRDILSNMNGDTVFNFGLSTTIDIESAAIGRNHLSVTEFDGDTTLAVGNTQIKLEGVFAGGDFMAVVRGQGAGAHTMVTFETFLPEQGEGVRTDARAINGIANEPFMTGDGTVRFSTTLENASSAFANSLGVYRVAADGTIFDVDVVFANTLDVAARTVDLGTPADSVKLGFFLIQNGFGAYGNLPDNLSFVSAGTGNPANLNDGTPLTLMSATLGALSTTAVFHSFQTLNGSDAIQVLSGVAPGGKDLLVAFEDLPTETGDNDFQDVVIRIHANQDDLFVV